MGGCVVGSDHHAAFSRTDGMDPAPRIRPAWDDFRRPIGDLAADDAAAALPTYTALRLLRTARWRLPHAPLCAPSPMPPLREGIPHGLPDDRAKRAIEGIAERPYVLYAHRSYGGLAFVIRLLAKLSLLNEATRAERLRPDETRRTR